MLDEQFLCHLDLSVDYILAGRDAIFSHKQSAKMRNGISAYPAQLVDCNFFVIIDVYEPYNKTQLNFSLC
jgi:hypothetical protein